MLGGCAGGRRRVGVDRVLYTDFTRKKERRKKRKPCFQFFGCSNSDSMPSPFTDKYKIVFYFNQWKMERQALRKFKVRG